MSGLNHWDIWRERERRILKETLGYDLGRSLQPWQRDARRDYRKFLDQIARAFRIPGRVLLGPVPAKAAHKRRYGR